VFCARSDLSTERHRSADDPRERAALAFKRSHGREIYVLNWAITFFLVAIVAALVGFSGIAAGAANIAQMLFILFLVLFAISLLIGLRRH
jgi:uncharacterized membrane protein YtjA (UPF0391 family)